MIIIKKNISIFIDESGDFGFVGEASKYYIITLVFHDQSNDITSNINKIKDKPVFHAGPIIRREYPFINIDISERKKLFQTFFMFTQSLPVKYKTFTYVKKEFNGNLFKMQGRMNRDIYNFFADNIELFEETKIIIYYDNGQQIITRVINSSLAITGLDYDFKQKVHPEDYRLFQVADFISTIKLLELKANINSLSTSEKMFIDNRHLKNVYIRSLRKKEFK